jgi:hypothetical protein
VKIQNWLCGGEWLVGLGPSRSVGLPGADTGEHGPNQLEIEKRHMRRLAVIGHRDPVGPVRAGGRDGVGGSGSGGSPISLRRRSRMAARTV